MAIGVASMILGFMLFYSGNYYAERLYRIEQYRTTLLSSLGAIGLYGGILLILVGGGIRIGTQPKSRRSRG
jgi:hypothetical protein